MSECRSWQGGCDDVNGLDKLGEGNTLPRRQGTVTRRTAPGDSFLHAGPRDICSVEPPAAARERTARV